MEQLGLKQQPFEMLVLTGEDCSTTVLTLSRSHRFRNMHVVLLTKSYPVVDWRLLNLVLIIKNASETEGKEWDCGRDLGFPRVLLWFDFSVVITKY